MTVTVNDLTRRDAGGLLPLEGEAAQWMHDFVTRSLAESDERRAREREVKVAARRVREREAWEREPIFMTRAELSAIVGAAVTEALEAVADDLEALERIRAYSRENSRRWREKMRVNPLGLEGSEGNAARERDAEIAERMARR